MHDQGVSNRTGFLVADEDVPVFEIAEDSHGELEALTGVSGRSIGIRHGGR